MTDNKSINQTNKILEFVFKGIQDKKGHDIVNLNLEKIEHAVCNNFVICHGDSQRQVAAIADSVQEMVRVNAHEKPWHKEGTENADWILLDYADVVVHIFSSETRPFYNLEGLWADAQIQKIES